MHNTINYRRNNEKCETQRTNEILRKKNAKRIYDSTMDNII